MRQIISIVVKNNSSVLARISSLYGRRGFNIDSLSVAATDDPEISRITIVTHGDDYSLEQIVKQTKKLAETIDCYPIVEDNSVCRELLLLKLVTDNSFSNLLVNLSDKYGAAVLDISERSIILELCATSEKIDSFVSEINDNAKTGGYYVKQVCRTGIAALKRGVSSY
ncbi:MAG: acetolactate synthase small subunit [Clostridia bacterium]|nr:acetolactate synthase small subunit [Clostridia bacterium]